MTLSQALAYLDESDPGDPHKGNAPVRSLADLRALCRLEDD